MIRGCRSQLCFLSLPSFSTRGVISSSSLLTDARFIRITSLLPLFLRVLSLTFGTSHTLLALITLSVPAVSCLTDIHTLTIGRRRLFTIHTLVVNPVSLSFFRQLFLCLIVSYLSPVDRLSRIVLYRLCTIIVVSQRRTIDITYLGLSCYIPPPRFGSLWIACATFGIEPAISMLVS